MSAQAMRLPAQQSEGQAAVAGRQETKVVPVIHVQGELVEVRPPGAWRGGDLFDCAAAPGGAALCLAAAACPCVVVGQLHDRVVRRGTFLATTLKVGFWMLLKYAVDVLSFRRDLGLLIPFEATCVMVAVAIAFFLGRIRRTLARRDGIRDAPQLPLCGIRGETLACHPCATCWLFRHDLLVRQPGQAYGRLHTASGTAHPLPV